jgi:hypothetical protein
MKFVSVDGSNWFEWDSSTLSIRKCGSTNYQAACYIEDYKREYVGRTCASVDEAAGTIQTRDFKIEEIEP